MKDEDPHRHEDSEVLLEVEPEPAVGPETVDAAQDEAELVSSGLLDHVVRESQRSPRARRPAGEVTIGRFEGLGEEGEILVSFAGGLGEHPLPARATLPLGKEEIGREVALLFEEGDPRRPLIMGVLRAPVGQDPAASPVDVDPDPAPAPAVEAAADGQRLVFEAEREIVLRCGQASITLTRAGKIILRGKYVLSRSSGVNRIKGGSVQIN